MQKHFIKRLAATGAVAALILPFAAFAQEFGNTGPITDTELGINEGGTISENIGLGGQDGDIKTVIARIVRVLLGFLGIIAVLIVLYGGFQWMTAAGNEERVSSARATLTAGLIGLIIILSAYAIASFIISTLLSETSSAA
ncbi:MAG: hypothetical protein WC052_00040 [Patescibacteria group bacterium]|jgi:phage shock protein PspC (stress-responsive transcriptional regulator)